MTEGNGVIETSAEARCPVCGKPCVLRIARSVKGEVVSAAAECPECGRTPVVYKILPTGDRRLVLADGSLYEPSAEVYSLRETARGLTGCEALRARLKVAEALRNDEREREAVSECLSVEEEAFGTDPLTPEARDIGISAAYLAGRIMEWNGDSAAADRIYSGALEHAEQSGSEDAAALRVEHAFNSAIEDPKAADSAAIRGMADEIEKSGGTAYRGSARAAVSVYSGLASLCAFRGMMKQSFTAARKAVRCAEAAMGASPSDESAADLLHSLHLCSSSAYAAGNAGKGREYAKKLLRTSESLKDGHPSQYADGMLMFAKVAADSDPELIPESRKRMEELIAFLPENKNGGLSDERIAMAYLYHSVPEADGDLDPDDLGRAYGLLRSNAFRGRVARDAFLQVGNSYLVYLQGRDPARADAVRAEMRSMGLFQSLKDEGYTPEDFKHASAAEDRSNGKSGGSE